MDNDHADFPRFREVEVAGVCDGMRLDRFLSLRFADRSRSFFARAIRSGEVRREDDAPLMPSSRVRGGQMLRIYTEGIAPSGPPPALPPIRYQDADLLVLDKPPGMLCHPAGTKFEWALISLAKMRFVAEDVDLVHRIDRDTSGLVILTRDVDINRALKDAMKHGRVFKEYEAIVRGSVPWASRVIDEPIGRAGGPIRIEMAVRHDGQAASTMVEVLERGDELSRVRCVLHTGRTHQIRVHLAHVGFPILGDRLYGAPAEFFLRTLEGVSPEQMIEETGGVRQALHHRRVRFRHPRSSAWVEVAADRPRDMRDMWNAKDGHGFDPQQN